MKRLNLGNKLERRYNTFIGNDILTKSVKKTGSNTLNIL